MEKEINEKLENLQMRIETLTDIVKKHLATIKEHFEEKEEDTSRMLEILSKMDKLINDINEEKIPYVKENLLVYVIGSVIGGLIMGLSLYKSKKLRE